MTDSSDMQICNLNFKLHRKPIKNLHINVLPPDGKVRVSAPSRMTERAIRTAVISRLPWIKKQQKAFAEQPRQSPREFVDGETQFLWGQKYRLRLQQTDHQLELLGVKHRRILVAVTGTSQKSEIQQLFDDFYKAETHEALYRLIDIWAQKVGKRPASVSIRKMKTKWGSCNTDSKRILINSELAKKPPECLEYILAHEFVHLLERKHNQRFVDHMDTFMPNWRERRDLLNSLPLAHEEWAY